MKLINPMLSVAVAPTILAATMMTAGQTDATEPPPGDLDAAGQTSAYYYFVHWMSVDRPDLALAQFADDAVVVASPACPPAQACIGRQMIGQRYIRALRSGRAVLPVRDQRFDGRLLRTHGESIPTTTPDGRRICAAGGYAFSMRDGRIVRIDEELDGSAGPGPCADVSPHLMPAAQRTKP